MSDWLDIHAYADGQLDGDEKRSVEERLKTCEKSQAELRAVQGDRYTRERTNHRPRATFSDPSGISALHGASQSIIWRA